MKKKWFLLLLVLGGRLAGVSEKAYADPATQAVAAAEEAAAVLDFEERQGQVVPADIPFRDEEGQPVLLGDLVDRPTIIAFEYFTCTDACGLLSMSLAATMAQMPGEAGEQYRVLTVSFDAADRPEAAKEKKRQALAVLGRPIPPEAWRFLTGEPAAIHDLTEAAGFRFERRGDQFVHPLGLVFLSPQRKIVRYIRGERFLPADLTFSVLEASTGTIGPTLSRVARFCFAVDPSGRKLTFRILRVGGAVTLTFTACFVGLLLLRGRKKKTRGGST